MARTTFIEMINGQIKAGREIKGVVVAVSGKKNQYTITDYTNDTVTLTEAVEGEEQDTITITPANALVAHYVNNPNPRVSLDVDKISIKKGVLSWEANGNAYSTDLGSYAIDRVLGSFAGIIYLLTNTDGDFSEVLMYDVQADKFDTSTAKISATAKMFVINDKAYIVSNVSEDRQVGKDDNGKPVMKPCVVTRDVFEVTNRLNMHNINEDTSIIVSEVRAVDDGIIVLFGRAYEDADGVVTASDELLVDVIRDGRIYVSALADANGSADVSVYVGGKYSEIVTIVAPTAVTVIQNGSEVTIKDSKAVAALKEATVFCSKDDVFDEDGNKSVKYTYANDDYSKVISVTVTNTDRGQKVKLG